MRDVRLQGPERPFEPALYVPHVVDPRTSGPVYLVVRAAADPVALVPAIRSAVARIDADLPLYNIRSFDEIRALLLTKRRLAMITMVVFAGLAFILSAIGLYGVVGYLVQAHARDRHPARHRREPAGGLSWRALERRCTRSRASGWGSPPRWR